MTRERLNSISLHKEMQRSYLEYAMSVIVGRALPDARDGLKPVQRRILFAMHELGLTPDRPFKKCARVVGDVLGKYHPHGDQAVYDALVRLVQDFNCKYPILDGHGNFGSIDDDPPAAMRYTETRLAEIANEGVLKEIDKETVDFSSNFDGSQQEPNVLPAQLPFLILNGCTGIAVGMATSIPPHNLNEVVNGLLELIKNRDLEEEKLLKFIPGPDFPTGGEILLTTGVKDTYLKGKGSIPMRGITHIEEVNPGKGKHKRTGIVITELPYQTSKSGWIEKLAELVNDGKISGVADIRDESDRDGMRILIEIRRDSDPEKVLKDLYRRTSLQCNYGATLLALVNGQPIQLSLKNLLINFLDFREETIIKRTNYSLRKIIIRLELIEGLIKALKNLKEVIAMIEGAKDVNEARENLIRKLDLNIKQADGVLAMPLRKLTGLEKNSLYSELDELKVSKKNLELILKERNELLKIMSTEFKDLKKRFGSKRKTKLVSDGDALLAERNANIRPNKELQKLQALESLPKDGLITIQANNQIKILSPKVINKLKKNENIIPGKEIIPTKLLLNVKDNPKILAITEQGKIGLLQWEFAGQKPGNINRLLPSGLENEKILTLISITKETKESLGLLTSDGRFKRLQLQEMIDISNRATTILKLKENVVLKSAVICNENNELIVITNIGRILRIKIDEENLPIMGKLAQGPLILNLFPTEFIVCGISEDKEIDKHLILITDNGKLLKVEHNLLRFSKKGCMGYIDKNLFKNKKAHPNIIKAVYSKNNLIISTNKGNYAQISSLTLKDLEKFKLNKNIILMDANEEIIDAISYLNK